MRLKLFIICLAVSCLSVNGCKDDSNPTGAGGGPTTYTGVMAGAGVSGSISFIISTPKRSYTSTMAEGDTLEVTGSLKLNGGATITLTGYYDVETGELSLTGGGYTFFGFEDEGNISGTFAYSWGSGLFKAEQGSSSTVSTYCGSYQDNSPGTGSGFFNMTISGTSILLIMSPSDGSGYFWAEGTLTGGTDIVIFSPGNPSVPWATGTLNTSNNTMSGTYVRDPGGTWSGSPCN